MTAAEREAEYKAAQAHSDTLKEAWHQALIAESPFRTNDLVVHVSDVLRSNPRKVLSVGCYDWGDVYLHLDLKSCFPQDDYRDPYYYRRIDESGNPLAPRGANEA